MRWLEPAIDRPLPIFLAALLVLVLGIYSLDRLPVKRAPSVEVPFSIVIVPFPGANPETVEAEIAVEIEEQLDSLEGLRHMTSFSGQNSASVFLEFEDRTDMKESVRDVRDRTEIAEAEFPSDAEAAVVWEISLEHFPIVMFTLSGAVDLYRLYEIAEDLRPSLESVPGVRTVEVFGGYRPEVRIHADPLVLAQHGLTLLDLPTEIRRQSHDIPTGQLSTDGAEQAIHATGEFLSLDEIRSITVATEPTGPISLGDVARVELSHERLTTGAWFEGQPSVTLIARRRPDVNTLETVRELKARVESLRPTLPPGVDITVTSDASREIGDMIRTLGTSAGWGMAFVVLVLFAVLGWRQAMLVASVLPFSLLFTFIGLYTFGMAISNISLFSLVLVLGIVVDGAIIVGEAIFAEHEAGTPPHEAAKRGLARVGVPVIAADLTTIAAYVPMLLMVGVMGQFMSVMPKVVIFALIGSIFIDHLFLPAAAARMGRGGRGRKRGPQLSWIRAPYLRWLDIALAHRLRVVGIAIAAFAGAMLIFSTGLVPTIFLPTVDHSRFFVNYSLPSGTNLAETSRVGRLLAREVESIPEVRRHVLTTGDTGALNVNPQEGGRYGPEYGKLTIELVPPSERNRSQSMVVEEVREILGGFAGVRLVVEEVTDGPPVGAALSLQISGHDLEPLHSIARDLEARIAELPAARDLRVDYDTGKPQIRVELDRVRAATEYGISPDQVSRTLLTAFHGDKIGRMWVEGERVDIRLRSPDELPYTADTVRELPMRARNGEIVPLGSVASIGLGFTHASIIRREGLRSITIRADNAPGTSSIELEESVREILETFELPSGVRTNFGGETEERDRSTESLWRSLGWAVLLIFIIIAVQFNSLRQPFIVLFTIPLAVVGVALGLLISGHPFSFMAFIGVVSLTGIVVNDGIVMVDAINKSRDTGLSLPDALRDAAERRFRPVILTTVTTIAGLLPLTLQVVEGGEFWVAIGITIISGLFAATILTLFVVPVLYSLIESGKQNAARPGEEVSTEIRAVAADRS